MWKTISKLPRGDVFEYNGMGIRGYCKQHIRDHQEIYRIFYYDSEPSDKIGRNPISKEMVDFSKTEAYKKQMELFDSIRTTPNFALRLGKIKWVGDWKLKKPYKWKKLLKGEITAGELTPEDITPRFYQKGVDMKIGIDIALTSLKKLTDIIILITGDQDIVPALKLARREGISVGLDHLNNHVNPHLLEHVDFAHTYIGKTPPHHP